MRTLTYYAATLDGYVADPGEFDFFPFEGGLRRPSSPSTRRPCPVHARGTLGLTDVPNRRFDTVVMGRGTHELAHPGRGVAHDLFEGPFTPTAFVPAWSRELDGGVRIEEYARKV